MNMENDTSEAYDNSGANDNSEANDSSEANDTPEANIISDVNDSSEANDNSGANKVQLSSHHVAVINTVYHNDYIMGHIFSFLREFKDRLHMDVVSLRVQDRIRDTEWGPLPASFEKLVIDAPNNFAAGRISLGRLYRSISQSDFPHKFMTILWKLLMYKRIVKTIVYGEHRKDPCSDNIDHGRLRITLTLMKYLDNFMQLKTLVLKYSDVEQNAINYLVSDECRFKHRIVNLSIREIHYGPWISHLINPKLRTLTIRIWDISIASALLDKINQLDLYLDTIDVTVALFRNRGDQEEIDVINGFSSRCTVLKIAFWNNLILAKHIQLWINIRSLIIDTGTTQILEDLSRTFENIKYLIHLERLTISERINKAGFMYLRNGLQGLTKLKYLNIIDRTYRDKQFGIISPFFEALPLSLEEIILEKFLWESGAIEKFCARPFNNLKSLTIRRPDRFGRNVSDLFRKLIISFHSLERFHFPENINSAMVRNVIDHPNLNDVMISVWNPPNLRSIPTEMVTALQNKFSTYRCLRMSEYTIFHLTMGQQCPNALPCRTIGW